MATKYMFLQYSSSDVIIKLFVVMKCSLISNSFVTWL
jgi:hypothetical protein